MSINTSANEPVTGSRLVALLKGTDLFGDAELSRKLGDLSNDRTVPLLGTAVGADGRAVVVNTSLAYTDGEARPTIVYVRESALGAIMPAPGPPPSGDVEAALAARDAEWRAWLGAAPEPLAGVQSEAQAILAWIAEAPDQVEP